MHGSKNYTSRNMVCKKNSLITLFQKKKMDETHRFTELCYTWTVSPQIHIYWIWEAHLYFIYDSYTHTGNKTVAQDLLGCPLGLLLWCNSFQGNVETGVIIVSPAAWLNVHGRYWYLTWGGWGEREKEQLGHSPQGQEAWSIMRLET